MPLLSYFVLLQSYETCNHDSLLNTKYALLRKIEFGNRFCWYTRSSFNVRAYMDENRIFKHIPCNAFRYWNGTLGKETWSNRKSKKVHSTYFT